MENGLAKENTVIGGFQQPKRLKYSDPIEKEGLNTFPSHNSLHAFFAYGWQIMAKLSALLHCAKNLIHSNSRKYNLCHSLHNLLQEIS